MTPEQMRRAATIIEAEAELWRLRGFGIAAREHADLARLLREQADAMEAKQALPGVQWVGIVPPGVTISNNTIVVDADTPSPPEGEK